MGGSSSKPEEIVALAQQAVAYNPPLGPPVKARVWRTERLTVLILSSQGNPLVYLDIALGRYGVGTPLGRITIELKVRQLPSEC